VSKLRNFHYGNLIYYIVSMGMNAHHDTEISQAPWWTTAVIYHVYPRSFADSNGDGIGDLAGIRSRIPYLTELGVQAIWISPCYPSPQRDHGYDVADYTDIEPDYGDLTGFDTLVSECRAAGIFVMMDIVPNHCSDRHRWFQAAIATGRGSPERERFYFRDGRGPGGAEPPNNWMSLFSGPAWTRVTEPDGTPGQWYLHTFSSWQPDLNWTHDDVITYFDQIYTFWLDRGVEGFRIDAVTVLGKAAGLPDAPTVETATGAFAAGDNPYMHHRPEGHVVWEHWRALLDDYQASHPGRYPFMVAEAYTPNRPDLFASYVSPDAFHAAFAFDLMMAPWHAGRIRHAIVETMNVLDATGGVPAWALSNHDNNRGTTRYGRQTATSSTLWNGMNLQQPESGIDEAVGLRRALASMLLTIALPGTIYLYQGEELGLPEVVDIPVASRQDPVYLNSEGEILGRDGCRVPLPWTESPAGAHGFSPAGSAAEWMPQPDGWGRYAVDRQQRVLNSTLAVHRRAIALRNASPDLRHAPLEWLPAPKATVLIFRRGELLVVANTGRRAVRLPADVIAGRSVLISSLDGHTDASRIPSDCTLWLTPAGN
jgi:alpha-glucosidase